MQTREAPWLEGPVDGAARRDAAVDGASCLDGAVAVDGAARPGTIEGRVLVLGRAGAPIAASLGREGIPVCLCDGVRALRREMGRGADVLVITELTERGAVTPAVPGLRRAVEGQAAWFDLPVVACVSSPDDPPAVDRWFAALEARGRVTLVGRAVAPRTLLSAVRAALSARRRQTEARALRDDLARARAERDALLVREREVTARAEAASRAKDDFLSTLSHELRTPLNAILGWTAMLLGGSLPPARARHALEIVDRNARAQARLVQDLLEASDDVGGRLELRVEPIDLADLVRLGIQRSAAAAAAKEIAVECDIVASLPMHGDFQGLLQVASNLVANAVKFTPQGGRVNVRLEGGAASAALTVSDTGPGISAECLPFVFDRFWQADTSTTRRFGGLGLGLSLVRRMVELHGGNSIVRSEGGAGATFVVTLPVAPTCALRSA